jgi:hypothetical protein
MKRMLVGSVAALVSTLFFAGCGSADNAPVEQTSQELASTAAANGATHGGLDHFYARPDRRACPSPACGGYWLVDPTHHSACDNQPSDTYVAGIYAGNQEVSPPCNDLLTGFLKPDPQDPQYNVFLLEL